MNIRINEKISVEIKGEVSIDELRAITKFADVIEGKVPVGTNIEWESKLAKPIRPVKKRKRRKGRGQKEKYDWEHIEGFIKDYLEQGNVLSSTTDAVQLAGVPLNGGNRQRITQILDTHAVRVGNLFMAKSIKENGITVKQRKNINTAVRGYRGNKQWNDEEIRVVLSNWDKRKSVMDNARKISKLIGRTPSQIQSRYYVLREKGQDAYDN